MDILSGLGDISIWKYRSHLFKIPLKVSPTGSTLLAVFSLVAAGAALAIAFPLGI